MFVPRRWIVLVLVSLTVACGSVVGWAGEPEGSTVAPGEDAILRAMGRSFCQAVSSNPRSDWLLKSASKSLDAASEWFRGSSGDPYSHALQAYRHAVKQDYEAALVDCNRALHANPDYRYALELRVRVLDELGRHNEAYDDYERLIEKCGCRDSNVFGGKAAIHLAKKQYDAAAESLKKAIEFNPDDAGKQHDAWLKEDLSPQSLAHGETQVRRMLKDRPKMAEHIDEASPVWRWAARRFAGEGLPDTIDWDPSAPVLADAEHLPMSRQRRGKIRAALVGKVHQKGKPFTGDQLWAMVVFELHNVRRSVYHGGRLAELAARGKLDEEEFVRRHLAEEVRAIQKTRAFLLQVYLPEAKKKGFDIDPELWRLKGYWGTVAEIASLFTDRKGYPWSPYASYYQLYSKGKRFLFRTKGDRLLECWRHLVRDECCEALEKCDEILDQDKNNIAARYLRAAAWSIRREYGPAIADCDRALAQDPSLDYVRELRALCLLETDRVDEGVAEIEKVLQNSPRWAESLACYGYGLAHQGKLQEAKEFCERAVKVDSKQGFVFYSRGFVRFKREEYDKAVADFTKAIVFDPHDDLAFELRAKAYEKLGKAKEAAADRDRSRALVENRLSKE